MLVESVSAILLISDNAGELAAFYKASLDLPLEDEVHDDVPPHYGCEIGDVHFAIHPSERWPGVQTTNAQSPIIVLATSDLNLVIERLRKSGIETAGPHDHGFAYTVSFRDPDGNQVEVLEFKSAGT